MRRLTDSIGTIRTGDYTKKVSVGGNDELTALSEEFNELVDILHMSEETRRQFVSDASHELKTPLASIKLLSDSILQNELDVETVREFVGDIGNEADRLTRMTQKLLSLTKTEDDNGKDHEITWIGPTLEKVARMISAIADEKNIAVTVAIDQDCSILIIEDDLYQILFNLAENGIKYNKDGGSLTLKLTRIGDDAVLQVADTGVGIPEASIDRVFERFYRVDKARSRQSGGSGLGLSIVKAMVERNDGTITVASQDSIGTTFTVTFPTFDMEVDSQ
jgi:signal transduction histidine kinase